MKIISSKQYKEYQQLKSVAAANETAEIILYCRDNQISLWGYMDDRQTVNFSAKYKGTEAKINSLEKVKQLKKITDEFNSL